MIRSGSVLVAVILALSCVSLTPSEVLLHVDADPISKKRARQLHVRITSQEGATRLDRVASLFGDPPEVSLPTIVPVVPTDDDATRTFTVSAELTDQDQVAFNKKAAVLSFVDQKIVDVDIYFSDLCIDVDCPAGQTCADGACVDIHTRPQGPDGAQAGDSQPGACTATLCWEQPRPTGETLRAACLFGADSGFVMGSSGLVLAKGLWQQEELPVPLQGSSVNSVACWAGGEAVATSKGSILERSASGWKRLDVGAPNLHSVWGADANDVWVVGDAGQVFRRLSHGAWKKIDAGVVADLQGVWGSAKTDVLFVGESSTFLRYDGASFSAVPPPPGADPGLLRVTGSSTTDVSVLAAADVFTLEGAAWTQYTPYLGSVSLAGGSSGLLVSGGGRGAAHFRAPNAGWADAPVDFPFVGSALRAAAVFGGSALLGGEGGAIARWSGTSWVNASVWLSNRNLHGLATDPDDSVHAVAVGEHGLVLERVGEGLWRRRVVGQGAEVVTPDLQAVWMGSDFAVAVGKAGTIAESPDGKDWSVVASGTTADLTAIDAAGGIVFAAGAAGTVLERAANGEWSTLSSAFPPGSDIGAIRGQGDGTLVVGAADGSVWRLGQGPTWTQVGTVPAAVTDVRVDPTGAVWVAASGIHRATAKTFVPVTAPGLTGAATHFFLTGTELEWVGYATLTVQRQDDGSFSAAAPPVNALSAAADGRVFMAGDVGRILAARP